MSELENLCYTFEAALEKAIEMEHKDFRHYLDSIRMLKGEAARKVLRDVALDELSHRHALEKALVEGRFNASGAMGRPVPTMRLDYVLAKKPLSADAGPCEALAHAIHQEKESVDFYQKMAAGCADAPMGGMFAKILEDETRHLQALEDLYEEHCMPEG